MARLLFVCFFWKWKMNSFFSGFQPSLLLCLYLDDNLKIHIDCPRTTNYPFFFVCHYNDDDDDDLYSWSYCFFFIFWLHDISQKLSSLSKSFEEKKNRKKPDFHTWQEVEKKCATWNKMKKIWRWWGIYKYIKEKKTENHW